MLFVFNATSVVSVLFLVFLEGLLSLDNALVLALLVRHLPADKQKKALVYGIWGAFIFRFITLFFLSELMSIPWLKLFGGAYLIYLAAKEYLVGSDDKSDAPTAPATFWRVVVMVELMDMAFSVDNVLAAVSVSTNYFIVMAGAVFGILMMRCSAALFVALIERFPRLQATAYHLVGIIGVKLIVEGAFPQVDFHSSTSAAPWLFWITIAIAISQGFNTTADERAVA